MTSQAATEPEVLEHYQMYIGGEWVDAASGEILSSVNPYTRQPWATVPLGGAPDVDRAVAAAKAAFDSGPWASSTPAQRARWLRNLAALIETDSDELARVQVLENGKLIREVGAQTKGLANYCYFFAGLAESIHGDTIPLSVPNMVNFTVREPIGVIGAITPWNSPLALLMWKLAPALAAGNTIVVKPSEVTPVSSLIFARLVEHAGIPTGVFNVVTGDGVAGSALAEHPDVGKIAFTGSTGVGKRVAHAAADRLARVSLELGGKSPNIVFADADIDNAINGIMAGIFAATGQTCLAGSRVLIENSVYDEVASKLVEKAQQIKIGNPSDPDSEMGTVSCQAQYDKVMYYIKVGEEDGAKLLSGGRHPEAAELQDGLFVEPTIFGDVTNDMRIAREEVFGPVVCLLRFTTEDDAMAIANDTPYGLASGLWTNDVRRVHRLAGRLRAGTVWVNTYRRTNYASPFGGYKESGIGRESGVHAIEEYTEVKSIWIDTGNVIKDPFNPRA